MRDVSRCPHTSGDVVYLSICFIHPTSYIHSLSSLWPPSSSCFPSTPFHDSSWLANGVLCVSRIQGDVGLPGPSGTPGDGSLRSEQTLTIYKGDKVTRQGKARSRRCLHNTLTHTHTHKRMWWGFAIKVLKRRWITQQAAKEDEEQWLQQTLQPWRGGRVGAEVRSRRRWRRGSSNWASVQHLFPATVEFVTQKWKRQK